jgi:tRNA(fMet)-specific endonuclease VapC
MSSTLQLDTNAVRAVIDGKSSQLDAWLKEGRCCISAIVEAEILYGLNRRSASSRVHGLVQPFLEAIEIRPWTHSCASVYGPLRAELERQGTPLAAMDLLIASHALAHDDLLVTADQAFRLVPGLRTMGWENPISP